MRAAFLDHVTLTVRDLEASKRFYRGALAAWGSREVALDDGSVAFGPKGSEDLVVAHAASLEAGGRERRSEFTSCASRGP